MSSKGIFMHIRNLFAILLLAWLPACSQATPVPEELKPGQIEFTISIAENTAGTFTIALGVANHGQITIPADQFHDSWTLATAVGSARASGEGLLPEVKPTTGEPQNVILWEGPLEPGSYVLQWGVPELGSSTARFEIVTGENGPQLGTFSMD
jgi:hypothetical protein